jgi:leucyl/phenylalanyl-tRNA--protein transferase
MFILTKENSFPDVELADENGLLAIGGDLSIEKLLLAYKSGIFPWYNETDPICWYSPDPRFVLFPKDLVVSKSMKSLMNKRSFRFTVNKAFDKVINNCKSVDRKGQDGTWIHEDIINAYTRLHRLGYAISAEAWEKDELAAGLYGIKMGNIFFGESMFALKANASKFAFINFVNQLQTENITLIDCQVYTKHLESLGAKGIQRKEFISILKKNIT